MPYGLRVDPKPENQLNLNARQLRICSHTLPTGYFRDGYCSNTGTHLICTKMTQEFLDYSKNEVNNDLSTPRILPNGAQFPGLKAGDNWCLCSQRWKQAYAAGKAPIICQDATNLSATGDVIDAVGAKFVKNTILNKIEESMRWDNIGSTFR